MNTMQETDPLIKAIHTHIQATSNNNQAPVLATISKVYDDNKHINATLENGDTIEYINSIGTPQKNENTIIVFLNGDIDSPFAITK